MKEWHREFIKQEIESIKLEKNKKEAVEYYCNLLMTLYIESKLNHSKYSSMSCIDVVDLMRNDKRFSDLNIKGYYSAYSERFNCEIEFLSIKDKFQQDVNRYEMIFVVKKVLLFFIPLLLIVVSIICVL